MAQTQVVLQDLVARAGVRKIDTECSKDELLSLSKFCDPWELIGRNLGLESQQISAVDADCRSTDLKRLGVLQKWKEMLSFKATYRGLVVAFIACGKNDQALKICQYLAAKEERNLNRAIDAVNRSSKHLGKIADSMSEWEGRLSDELDLSPSDVANIKQKYPYELRLQTREALQIWKQGLGSAATYNRLIKVFTDAGFKGYADEVRRVGLSGSDDVDTGSVVEVGDSGSTASQPAAPSYVSDPTAAATAGNNTATSLSPTASSPMSPPPSVSLTASSQENSSQPSSLTTPTSTGVPAAGCVPPSNTAKVKDRYLKLIKWTSENGQQKKFDLMEKIESKWRDVAQLTGVSIAKIDSISTKHRENPTECLRTVLGMWMENPPEDVYPNTWHGLIELLNDCEVKEVANDLKIALSKANICQFPQE